MKEKLQKMLEAKMNQRAALNKSLVECDNAEERQAAATAIEALDNEISEVREMLAACDQPAPNADPQARGLNPQATMGMGNGAQPQTQGTERNDDPRATMEYRKAFMEYVRTGKRTEALMLEKRSDDQTELADLGVLIPTTVVQEIIKGVEKVYGQLYSKVKKTNLKGGVKYPIGSFSATFNRIYETKGSEGTNPVAPTDRQNGGSVSGYVEFGYKIGEIRLAQTLLMAIMEVQVFEAELAKVIVEAYVEAMDKEIIKGDATNNEMCGILTNDAAGLQRIDASHIIEISENDMLDWKTWQKKLFAKIPLSMRALRPEFVMTAGTFEANIETLEDSNGQPVARNIYNPITGDEEARFKGRTVTFVEEDIFPNFDDIDLSDGDSPYFGMYWVADQAYAINSNLEFAVRRYFDEEKNQWVDKGIVINDGKILDPKYIFLLKKVANS